MFAGPHHLSPLTVTSWSQASIRYTACKLWHPPLDFCMINPGVSCRTTDWLDLSPRVVLFWNVRCSERWHFVVFNAVIQEHCEMNLQDGSPRIKDLLQFACHFAMYHSRSLSKHVHAKSLDFRHLWSIQNVQKGWGSGIVFLFAENFKQRGLDWLPWLGSQNTSTSSHRSQLCTLSARLSA